MQLNYTKKKYKRITELLFRCKNKKNANQKDIFIAYRNTVHRYYLNKQNKRKTDFSTKQIKKNAYFRIKNYLKFSYHFHRDTE